VRPRITFSVNTGGELQIWLNEQGRDLLVKELQTLASTGGNDHFHMGSWEGAEVSIGAIPYQDGDQIIHTVKVLFRPDEWDREYFPHVLSLLK
jgi:hypothetical protein